MAVDAGISHARRDVAPAEGWQRLQGASAPRAAILGVLTRTWSMAVDASVMSGIVKGLMVFESCHAHRTRNVIFHGTASSPRCSTAPSPDKSYGAYA